jgi:predicted nucleic acid-binding protein
VANVSEEDLPEGGALAHEITAYDSAYLALAEQEGCDLWTGDLSLYRAVSKKLRWVRWIGDYTSIL